MKHQLPKMSGLEIPTLNIRLPTSEAPSSWISPIEDCFAYLGLTTPMLRLTGAAAGVGLALYVLKPSSFFDGEDSKPWALWSGSGDSVLFPWWLFALLVGLATSVFI